LHAWYVHTYDTTRCAPSSSSLPGAPQPELKIHPVLLDDNTTTAAAAAGADPNPELQAHLKCRHLIRGHSGGRRGRRRRRREEAVDDGVGGGGAVRRREVEVGKRSSAVVVVRCRRRAALPEPGPVPPVDVHVAAQRLRRPELPPAVPAGVAGRRQRRRPWEAAGGQAEVVVARRRRRRRHPRLQRLQAAAAVVSTALHCWWPAVWSCSVGS